MGIRYINCQATKKSYRGFRLPCLRRLTLAESCTSVKLSGEQKKCYRSLSGAAPMLLRSSSEALLLVKVNCTQEFSPLVPNSIYRNIDYNTKWLGYAKWHLGTNGENRDMLSWKWLKIRRLLHIELPELHPERFFEKIRASDCIPFAFWRKLR